MPVPRPNHPTLRPAPFCCAANEKATGVPIPSLASGGTDPITAVNVTVLSAPNARAQGALGCLAGCLRSQRAPRAGGRRLPRPPLSAVPLSGSSPCLPPLLPTPALPACAPAEMLVDLPLSYFLPPKSATAGELPLVLDLESKR